jgi:uncharacterized protein DUF4129
VSDVPIDVGRDAAREAATRELSDPAYQAAQPSWFDKALRWVIARLNDLLNGLAGLTTGGIVGLVILLLLIVALIVVIRLRVGKFARSASAAVFAGRTMSASDHRRAAEEAAAQGDLAEAVRERFRAIARGLEERGVLDERSGRTVDELAREAGGRLPGHTVALRTAARIFDDVWYGGRPATTAGYEQLVDLDLALDGARR